MGIRVFNTLGKRVEDFVPSNPPYVTMYVCGPTVYDEAHLGHARTNIAFDIILRFLEFSGYKVYYVRNITDVGHLPEDFYRGEQIGVEKDRIVARAEVHRIHPMELAEKYMISFFEDMDSLGNKRPNIQPRATMHINDMIEAIKELIDKGYAYIIDGSVYYDVGKFEGYGKLSGIKKEELIKHRVEPDPKKRNPADFALWRAAPSNYPLGWNSPWGYGYPGWHIECSIMSMRYLGQQIDIHGGGPELIFPHHENEIAQSETLTGKSPFVKYWLHTGWLTVRGQKMSKSLGNFITIKEALKKHKPDTIRLFIASSHYRSQVDYSDEAMEMAKERLEKIENILDRLSELISERVNDVGKDDEKYMVLIKRNRNDFIASMQDDFNTPSALASLFQLVNLANSYIEHEGRPSRTILDMFYFTIKELSSIFGILKDYEPLSVKLAGREKGLLELIIQTREELRSKGFYELSDKIRSKLADIGIKIEDTKHGTKVTIT